VDDHGNEKIAVKVPTLVTLNFGFNIENIVTSQHCKPPSPSITCFIIKEKTLPLTVLHNL
jgi:hypothetical protein